MNNALILYEFIHSYCAHKKESYHPTYKIIQSACNSEAHLYKRICTILYILFSWISFSMLMRFKEPCCNMTARVPSSFSCVSAESFQVFVPESAQVGKPVGKIKAEDEDVGLNAEIKYSIINQEGANVFSIATDKDTREGIISLKKVLSHLHRFLFYILQCCRKFGHHSKTTSIKLSCLFCREKDVSSYTLII